jgi:GNAT superfamily N-acetyltransferase
MVEMIPLNRIKIRHIKPEDAKKIFELEKRVWGDAGANLDMINSRIETFPDGGFVATKGEQVVGVVFFELVHYSNGHKTWYEYTDNGFIKKSHEPTGDMIFGIDLSVSEKYSGKKIGTNLLLKVAEFSIRQNLKGGFLGGRVPFYYKYSDMPIEEYLRFRDESGKLVDPELRFYKRAGLRIKRALPNYFNDPHSLDYGVLLEWGNPFYGNHGRLLGSLYAFIFKLAFKIEMMVSK